MTTPHTMITLYRSLLYQKNWFFPPLMVILSETRHFSTPFTQHCTNTHPAQTQLALRDPLSLSSLYPHWPRLSEPISLSMHFEPYTPIETMRKFCKSTSKLQQCSAVHHSTSHKDPPFYPHTLLCQLKVHTLRILTFHSLI